MIKRILWIVLTLWAVGVVYVVATTDTEETALSTLRISEEGLTPAFSPTITDYYFVASPSLEELTITALPASAEASVYITGNTQIPMGESTISIVVTTPDGTSSTTYTIHVTKTDNIASANANLETLAIEGINLQPFFQPYETQYTASVPYAQETVRPLAIPVEETSQVTITGGETLVEGDNPISIHVTAPNGTTQKVYSILIHRRSMEEEEAFIIQQEEQHILLETLLRNDIAPLSTSIENPTFSSTENPPSSVETGKQHFWYWYVPALLLACFIFAFGVYRQYMHNKKTH